MRYNLHCCDGVWLRCPRLVCLPSFAFEFSALCACCFTGCGAKDFPVRLRAVARFRSGDFQARTQAEHLASRADRYNDHARAQSFLQWRNAAVLMQTAANSVSILYIFLAKLHDGWDAFSRVDT